MDVTYDPLPAVTDVRQSLQQQVIIHEKPATKSGSPLYPCLGDIGRHFRMLHTAARKCSTCIAILGIRSRPEDWWPSTTPGAGSSPCGGRPRSRISIAGRPGIVFVDKFYFIRDRRRGGLGYAGEFYPRIF